MPRKKKSPSTLSCDVVNAWMAHNQQQTAAMIDIAMAAVMVWAGIPRFPVSMASLRDAAKEYDIVRKQLPDGSWEITVQPKATILFDTDIL